jgi:hypothetical protein
MRSGYGTRMKNENERNGRVSPIDDDDGLVLLY